MSTQIRKPHSKCTCGNLGKLTIKPRQFRYQETVVTVLNVPLYECEDCGESYFEGSDAYTYANLAKDAVLQGKPEIDFNNGVN